MSTKTKPGKKFRVATAGATIDGRTIKPEWLTQAAANYDPANIYGARINVDHYMGFGPASSFGAFGDVAALSTETNAKTYKLELWAELVPNARAIELNKAGQKVYTSIEIIPSFADSGEAYLVGLALTDTPASLATSRIEFSAQAPDAVLSAAPFSDVGKLMKAETFIMAGAIELDFDAPEPATGFRAQFADLKKAMADKFKRRDSATLELATEFTQSIDALGNLTISRLEAEAARADQLGQDFAALQAAHNTMAGEFQQLKSSLEKQEGTPPRPTSIGGTGQTAYDAAPY